MAIAAASETPLDSPQPATLPFGARATNLRRSGRLQQIYIPSKNEPGELLRIDKNQLAIDAAYQRTLDYARIARMASNWSWVACGTLIVSRRRENEGIFLLMDGQHRWEAAKLIDDIADLPCLCFPIDQVRDEAIGFLAANTERKLPTLATQFKALIIAQNPEAMIAERLARQAGRHIAGGTGPYTISCVAELLRLIQADLPALERVWPRLIGLCEAYPMSFKVLRGVVSLERRLTPAQSLTTSIGERLLRAGYTAVVDEINRIGQIERNFSERSCAEGVLRAVNKGRGRNLIVLEDLP